MRARTLGINATIPAVVGVEVAVLAAIVIFPPARMSWWPTAAAAVVAIAVLMLTMHRRNAVRWFSTGFAGGAGGAIPTLLPRPSTSRTALRFTAFGLRTDSTVKRSRWSR